MEKHEKNVYIKNVNACSVSAVLHLVMYFLYPEKLRECI